MWDNKESELVARFKAGDLYVFNLLTRMWYERILSLLYRLLGNIQDAEDVCQKTFITAYSRLSQLNDNERFSTWLYRIANNHAIDELRDRKRLSRGHGKLDPSGQDHPVDPPDSDQVDLEAGIDGAELRRLFESVMQSIPDEQRVVVVMKLYQDLKFTEIGEILEVPVNTVKTRMYTGLRAMKDALSNNRLIEEILKDAM